MLFQVVDCVQLSFELFVGKQRMNHAVTIEADIHGDSTATAFGREVVPGRPVDHAITKRTFTFTGLRHTSACLG